MTDKYTDYAKKDIFYNKEFGSIPTLSQEEKKELKMRILNAINANLA